ncbi:MdtA/MuxA family multidrug efflux RND transporter periplasmic adaptor subunit [Aquabacter sp. CN5-332]|uniref:MdtA/MuxA family multidrug efflux RND transporter periplasmic adaptor subunit n=1 Tax=Aquabacter sp. CN5-332 TaxID=3156608 RepID=UPI0032B395B7
MNDPRPLGDLKGEPIAIEGLNPRKRRRFPWSAVIFLLLLALVGAGWFIRPNATAPAGGRGGAGAGPIPVASATAQKADLPIMLTALGTVTPLVTVTVKSQISGRLTAISFKEGQDVKAGDPLAEVDPRPYEAALQQAQGQLARDQAQQKNAQMDLERVKPLVAKNAASQQQVDTQDALVKQWEGTIAVDKAQVRTAELNVEYCHIVAPVAGRVGIRLVDVGNYVQAGDSSGIVVIAQLKPITVVFSLPEDQVPAVLRRVSAGAELPVTVFDRNRRAQIATGKLTTVDNQVDVSTGTVKLKAEFPNTDDALFPIQFVNVDLLVDTLSGATVIPSAAVQRGAPGTFVYLIQPDESVTVRKVVLGPSHDDKVAVTSGLAPGDKIVLDGADKLKEGARVREPDAQRPAQQGAATVPPDAPRRSQRPAQ